MLDLQTLTSGLNTSLSLIWKGPESVKTWKPGDFMQTISTQFPDRCLRLSSYMPMWALGQGVNIEALHISIVPPLSADDETPLGSAVHTPFNIAMLRIVTLTYISFYEHWRPHVEQRFGADINHWPDVFAFARRLRDFVVHNNAKVGFKSPNAKPVTWYNITYAPADNGKDIWQDLNVADVMVLVFELDDEMTALGFPAS